MACPVTDYVAEHSAAGKMFLPKLFQGFPEIKEALIANRMQAGFLVAPMAIALRSQGVPIKIVYLGHRYGSAFVVAKNGPVRSVADLRGKKIAIPSRFSDERLIVGRALRANGLSEDDVKMLEMAPPDVASALNSGAIDAFVMGEPFPAQAELGGYGRVLFFAKEYWPDYISCVLVVRDDVIENRPDAVQLLVDGIARSGMWLDEGKPHREYAAEFVGRYYYQQPPKLLRWALTQPIDRVMYTPLSPTKPDFDLIVELMVNAKLLDKPISFEEFVDPRFAERTAGLQSWQFEPGN
ncbi:MAG: ABC transporter substrate-binding protein [Kofleriaceae bacterium]